MSELKELLERFRRGPEIVAVSTTGASGAQIDFLPAPGKWSVRQIACHLADAEGLGAIRFRRLVAEENPDLGDWDRDAWAEKLGYNKRKISHALEVFPADARRQLRASETPFPKRFSQRRERIPCAVP